MTAPEGGAGRTAARRVPRAWRGSERLTPPQKAMQVVTEIPLSERAVISLTRVRNLSTVLFIIRLPLLLMWSSTAGYLTDYPSLGQYL
jgi:hypothetical protein